MTKTLFSLLLCLITLTGCSLTSKPTEAIINSGSTMSGVVATGQVATGVDLLSGEDLTLSGSSEINTGDTKFIQNNEGDILFQKLLNGTYFKEGIGNGPLYEQHDDGSITFIPDFLPQKIQKLELSKVVSLYIKTYPECTNDTGNCFRYSANIGYISTEGERFTTSITGELIPYPGMINSRLSKYIINNDTYIINMPNGNNEEILIFDYSNKKSTTSKKIFQKLTQKENYRNSDKSCFVIIRKDDLMIELYKAKTKCGQYVIPGDEFEKAIYQRNPETDTFTFIKAEPITNQ